MVKFNPSSSTEEGSGYIPVPVMEDDNVTVFAVNEEGQKSKDLLSWKSLRDINESLAPLFTVMNPNTGRKWSFCVESLWWWGMVTVMQ